MKQALLLFSLMLAALVPLRAGGVFYNSNQSAEYLRSFDRNSCIDNADIVYYNMAGTVKLKPGLTLNISNQSIFQWASVTCKGNPVLGDRSYRSSNPAWLVPNFYAAYRRGNLAWFTGVETIGATAIREWRHGLPTMDLLGKQKAGYGGAGSALIAGDAYADAILAGRTQAQAQAAAVAAGLDSSAFPSRSYLKGSSCYLAWRHGAAYQVCPWLSLAVAGRLVVARQDLVGRVEAANSYHQNGHDLRQQSRILIHKTDQAAGYSGEIGLDLFPGEGLVLNLTYEMATPLVFRTAIHGGKDGGGLFVDGARAHLDLPQTLRFGLGYQVTRRLRASMGMNAYLEKSANFSMLDSPLNDRDHRKDYGNTYEESASLEYRVRGPWLLSLGVNRNQIGQAKASTRDVSVPGGHADYVSLGAGFQYQPRDNLKLNLGIGHTRFITPYANADVLGDRMVQSRFAAQGVAIQPAKEYDKRYLVVAFGIDYRFSR